MLAGRENNLLRRMLVSSVENFDRKAYRIPKTTIYYFLLCGQPNRLMHNDVTRLDAREECWS
jgi:hypothetical protein